MAIIECGFPAVNPNPADALEAMGPPIVVELGFDPAMFSQSLPAALSGQMVAITPVSVPALIDTGAQQSCIDEALAQQLQLPLIDQQPPSGVGGTTVFNVYLTHISIPTIGVQYGRFTGVHLQAGGQIHRVLIGRTLLKDTLLVCDGRTGSVKLAR